MPGRSAGSAEQVITAQRSDPHQRIERVDQFLLGTQLAGPPGGQLAQVFQNPQRCPAMPGPKLVNRLRLDCLGQFAGKIDRGRRTTCREAVPIFASAKRSVPFGRQDRACDFQRARPWARCDLPVPLGP